MPETRVERAARIIAGLRGNIVVSCQARPGEALHGPQFMVAMALSAIAGGAAGVRVEGPDDICAVRAATTVPLIGLWKVGDDGVYITPTLAAAEAVALAGADIVALDGTDRARPDGLTLAQTIASLKGAGMLVMADVSTLSEGRLAEAAGADIVSTTLSGYTPDSRPGPSPDLDLVTELAAELSVPVFAEGRISTPDEAAVAFSRGATAVVVGSAITRPQVITAAFVNRTTSVYAPGSSSHA
jgi:N-acylglucosamine-6-phosphate 2-epimerase